MVSILPTIRSWILEDQQSSTFRQRSCHVRWAIRLLKRLSSHSSWNTSQPSLPQRLPTLASGWMRPRRFITTNVVDTKCLSLAKKKFQSFWNFLPMLRSQQTKSVCTFPPANTPVSFIPRPNLDWLRVFLYSNVQPTLAHSSSSKNFTPYLFANSRSIFFNFSFPSFEYPLLTRIHPFSFAMRNI